MTIAVDAVGRHSFSGSITETLTFTHTPVGTPSSVVLFMGCTNRAAGSVTYGGVAMTNITLTSTNLWYLESPPAGPQTVVINLVFPIGFNTVAEVQCATFTGTDTPLFGLYNSGTSATSDTSATTASLAPNFQAGDAILGQVYMNQSDTITQVTDSNLFNFTTSIAGIDQTWAVGYETGSGDGLMSFSWTIPYSFRDSDGSVDAIVMKVAAAAVTSGGHPQMMWGS